MSARQFYYNNIDSTLTAEALADATVLQIAEAVFPGVTAPDFYLATLESIGGGKIEIVKVVDVSGTTLTVERGHEEPAQDFSIGAIIQTRSTAGTFDRCGQQSDLGASFPFVPTIVNVPLTLYIDPAGDDANGDGSQSSPWASLYKVFTELSMLRFADGGNCTIECAAGTYPMDAQLLFDHPQGGRVTIKGASGFTPITGMPIGDYSVDRNNPTSAPPTATEFDNTAGTLPQNAIEATRATQRDLDRVNNRATLAANAPTIFQWNASGANEAKVVFRSSLGLLDNVAFDFFTPSGALDGRFGLCVGSGAVVTITDVTVVGATWGVCAESNSVLLATSVAVAGSVQGVVIRDGASARIGQLYTQGCIRHGVICTGACSLSAGTLISSGNGLHGVIAIDGTTVRGSTGTWTCSGNGEDGLQTNSGASVSNEDQTITVSGNGLRGAYILSNSDVTCDVFRSIGNQTGLFVDANGSMLITSSTVASLITNNQSNGFLGDSNGILTVKGDIDITNNDSDGVFVRLGAAIIVLASLALKGNAGQAFDAQYAGPCDLGDLTCDLTNLSVPHLQAIGGTHVRAVAPGSGNVDPGIVYSPPVDTTSPPDSAVFLT